MILYAIPVSTYGAKVRIALTVKNIEYRMLAPPGGYSSDAYKRIIPLGTIPGIVDGDVKISESDVIIEYLEEKYPDPPLLHGDAAARARQRLLSRYHDLWLEPHLRELFRQVSPATRETAVVERQIDLYQARLDQLEQLIAPQPYLASEHISMADIAFPATLTLADILLPAFARTQRLGTKMQAWRTTAYAHPAVKAITEDSGRAAQTWLQNKLS
jgi:glutathione S-transferase